MSTTPTTALELAVSDLSGHSTAWLRQYRDTAVRQGGSRLYIDVVEAILRERAECERQALAWMTGETVATRPS